MSSQLLELPMYGVKENLNDGAQFHIDDADPEFIGSNADEQCAVEQKFI